MPENLSASTSVKTLNYVSGDRVLVFGQPQGSHSQESAGLEAEHQATEMLLDDIVGYRFDATTAGEITPEQGWAATVVSAETVQAWRAHPPQIVFDVDSTLIKEEVIELLARHAGKEAEVAEVTERAMRGEIDFADSLHHRVATLKDLPLQVINEVSSMVTVQAGAQTLIDAIHSRGGKAYAVSGGFNQVLAPLAQKLGLDDYLANTLGTEGEVLTGKVEGQVVDRAVKAAMLHQWRNDNGLPEAAVIAVGDGANDTDMLDAAGFAVAYYAKPALREHADLILDIPHLGVVSLLLNDPA